MPLHPSLFGSVAAVLAACLVGYALGRAGGRLVPPDDPSRARTRARRLLWILFPATYVLALFALTAGGWLDLTDRVAALAPGAAEGIVGLLLVFGAPALACVAPYLGLFPSIRAARDIEMTTRAVAVMLLRYVTGFVALLAALLAVTLAVWSAVGSAAGVLVGIVVCVIVLYAASPLVVLALTATRQPADREGDRLVAAATAAGLSTRWVRVQATRGSEVATAFVRGLPGVRILGVTDHLLETVDDATLRGTLALRAGRLAVFHTEVRLALVLGTILAVFQPWLVSVPVPGLVVQVGGAVGGVAGLWVGRRLVFRADRIAAERVGTDCVADAIDRLTGINDAPRSLGVLSSLVRMEPSVDRRIERLRDAADSVSTDRTDSDE